MSKIGIKGISKFKEPVITFNKEPDGTYTKYTKILTRDRLTNSASYKKRNNPVIKEGPYRITDDPDNYDEKISYQDHNGDDVFMYFVKCESDD
jgi:hypothetical protein